MPLRTDRRHLLLALAASALLALPFASPAQQPKAVSEVPMLDPWVPPAVREKALVAPVTEGEALRAQARAKLKRRFEAAAGPSGSLTREQARAAGLGAIAERFEAIDRHGQGAVRFEDYERFLADR